MKFNATLHNVNIRGSEVKTNSKGEEYCLVRFEDEHGAPIEMVDKDKERFDFYKRNTDMDLTISVYETRQFTNFRIIEAKILDNS